ncbi:hypothetical protein ACFY2H_30790 [Streptomyces griseofuscus]|uniref:hypothetical protein n=1 Tax=Streptomycetaceae TaxID=2062 RepID=UPI00056346B9|nr:hypothetical protein [Actinacidiphila yeochonensis]
MDTTMPDAALTAVPDPASPALLRPVSPAFARTAQLSTLSAIEREDDQAGFEAEPDNAPAATPRLRAVRTAVA